MKRRGVWSAIGDSDTNQKLVGRRLRVLGDDVEVAIFLEDAGVHELELGISAAPPLILLDEPRVRKLALRILVETLHIGVGRRGVEVEVIVLDVLAVVPLRAGEAENPLLENRVLLVPEREREAEPLVIVRDPEEAVLSPAIGAGPRVVMREVVPRRPVGGVVLTDRAPLALRQVGSPPPPVGCAGLCLCEPSLFRRHGPALRLFPMQGRRPRRTP